MRVIMTVERRASPPGISGSMHLCSFCEKINALYSLRSMFSYQGIALAMPSVGRSDAPVGARTQMSKPEMRIGYGWDSHEFKPGIPLKIGGVTVAHDKGLGGHSDGDVLLTGPALLPWPDPRHSLGFIAVTLVLLVNLVARARARSYPVLVGRGARHEVSRLLPPTALRAAVVTQDTVSLIRSAIRCCLGVLDHVDVEVSVDPSGDPPRDSGHRHLFLSP